MDSAFHRHRNENALIHLLLHVGLPDFSWYNIPTRRKIYQITTKYSKWPQTMPNNNKIFQMATNYTKWTKNLPDGYRIYQHLLLQDHPKFTLMGIFGLKINHLAILAPWLNGVPDNL
jgi:hypothetical protein